jgi:5-methylcytosine-specific restriction endonuclease McrA
MNVFLRRTNNQYCAQKRRAEKAGVTLDYDLEKLRQAVRYALEVAKRCVFCGCVLTDKNFSVDHCYPTSRGGAHRFDNMHVCCQRCNETKGPLTTAEFYELLGRIRDWPEAARRNVLARLRAGGRLARA